jgi:hypothetical protein
MAQTRGAPGLSRLRLLALALAIPVAGLATLALVVAFTHRGTPLPPGPPRIAVVTPTAEPTPTEFAALLTDTDSFILLGPRAFGSISPTSRPSAGPAGVSVDLSIANPPSGLPTELPVWELTQAALDPPVVASRFGLGPSGETSVGGDVVSWAPDLLVNASLSTIWYTQTAGAAPRLGGVPRDRATALTLATRWLEHAGLAPFAGTREIATIDQTATGESASFPEWTITWQRTAPGYPAYPLDTISARVSADGTLKELELSRPRVDRGALYPLRPWQDALRDAQQGRWYQQCCGQLPELATPGKVHVTISSVSLRYAIAATPQGLFAVPMYAFVETGFQPGLVPAIAP